MSSLYLSLADKSVSEVLETLVTNGFDSLGSDHASTEIVGMISNDTSTDWSYKASGTMQGTMQNAQSEPIAQKYARAWTQKSMGLDGSFGWVIYSDDNNNQLFVGYCVYFDGAQAKYLAKYEKTNFSAMKNDSLLAMIDSQGSTGGDTFSFNDISVAYSGFEKTREGVAQSRVMQVKLAKNS